MPKHVENKLRSWRNQRGFTQEELATKAGVSRQTIIAIERGSYTPSVLLALKLAEIFQIAVEEIFQISKQK